MADLPAAVADTHALLFHASASRALGRRAAAHFEACERQQALVLRAGGRDLGGESPGACQPDQPAASDSRLFQRSLQQPGVSPVDLTSEQVYQADDLRFTRDPFDALIVAAARTLALPLLTRDADIRASGAVRVIW